MAAYLQLGHDSWNLLGEKSLRGFSGIVLSPVNDSPSAVVDRLKRLKRAGADVEVVFDAQLYNPRTVKGSLPAWGYLPGTFETTSWESASHWAQVVRKLVESATAIGANAVCSPAFVPRSYTNDYYRLITDIADSTEAEALGSGCAVLLTAIVPLQELAIEGRSLEIASILSSASVDRVYLIFMSDRSPREHHADLLALHGAMSLVRLLSAAMRVQIAFCGHDALLWKAAGAADITSWKFLNLRRFSFARWEDSDSQGRVIPYWNDAPLVTYLREADVVRLSRVGLITESSVSENPYSIEILKIIKSGSGAAWLGLSWRQYLYWFSDLDGKISGLGDAKEHLLICDRAWREVEANDILLTDRSNDGSWVRAWISACMPQPES